MNKLLSRIENRLCRPWLNIFMTLYLNFRLCDVKDAIHFPLLFYGRVYLDCTMGKFIFPNGAKTGSVRFGMIRGHFQAPKGRIFICLKEGSRIIIDSFCSFSIDTTIRLCEGAVLRLGEAVRIGDGVKIMSENEISIGAGTEVTYESQIIDTNFHYMVNNSTQEIIRKNLPIIIGKRNWIGNHTTIMKGTHTGDNCIIASNSLLNKNYSDHSGVMIVGTPAKIVRDDMSRIYDLKEEYNLDRRFMSDNSLKSVIRNN